MFRRSFLRLASLAPTLLAVRTPLAAQSATSATPPDKTIHLLDAPVAGIQFAEFASFDALAELSSEQTLVLIREPENAHDTRAIGVYTMSSRKVGFVPRKCNTVPSNLMDQDIALTCTITSIAFADDPWERVMMRLDMLLPNAVTV